MMQVETNYSLKELNTFGFDVKTACYVRLTSVSDVRDFLSERDKSRFPKPWVILGGGSNMLFCNNFSGTVIHPDVQGIEQACENKDDIYLRVGAGVRWDDFVEHCVSNNWAGVENLSLIPGNVGASPVQNIGAYGVEAKDSIVFVKGFYLSKGIPFMADNEGCMFGYRDSIFKRQLKGKIIVTQVSFRLSKKPTYITHYGNVDEELKKNYNGELSLKNIRKAIISIRESKLPDPKTVGNAGSFFKNPIVTEAKAARLKKKHPNMPTYPATEGYIKLAAGWLIEQCGWKGKRVGNVGVYPHQALVLVHYGGGQASEIVELSKSIQLSVKQEFGVKLEPEVIFI